MNTPRIAFSALILLTGFTGVGSTEEAATTPLPAACGKAGMAMDHDAMVKDAMMMSGMDMQKMDEAHKAFMQTMMKLHPAMMQGIMAKDPDVAFACGMIAHHQGAIDMAKLELKYGKDEENRKMAQDI